MQDVDRPAHIEVLSQPAGASSPCIEAEALRDVPRPEDAHRIGGHRGRRRDVGQGPAVGATEPKLAVRLSIELVALLVDGAVVPATEHGEIRQRGGAALCPVTDVMTLADPDPAAREAATAVPMVQRSP